MKKYINVIKEYAKGENIGNLIIMIACVIVIGMMTVKLTAIDVNAENDVGMLDGRIEMLEEYSDELLEAVQEFNDLYYVNNLDEMTIDTIWDS